MTNYKHCPEWAFNIYLDFSSVEIPHVLDVLSREGLYEGKKVIYDNDMMSCVESQLVAEYLGLTK